MGENKGISTKEVFAKLRERFFQVEETQLKK
jgi:hypothetical protein